MTLFAERPTLPDREIAAARASAALDAIAAAIGDAHVLREADALAEFSDPYRPDGEAGIAPAGLVQPVSTEQVSTVVRIANEHGVPVWTSSQGRNFGYGGAEARVEGSIALSLRRMDAVVEVDTELGYAVVEPGVTFFDLYEALKGTGFWMSCPDLGRGSVVGNALDHGLGYTPYGDHTGQLCGMEVVLPDGEVLRTGTGGIDGSPNFHVHKRGFGPSLDGLFAQSNLGIVTRVGVWLMPEPEVYAPGGVMVPREEDLEVLVDTLRPLLMDGTIQGYPLIVHAFGPVSMVLPPDTWSHLTGPGTAEELAPLREMLGGLGHWIMRFALYGPAEVVEINKRRVEAAFGAIPGAQVDLRHYTAPYTPETVDVFDQVPAGIPNMDVVNSLNAWGGEAEGGHLDFSPVTPFTGRDAVAAYHTLWEQFTAHDVKSIYTLIARDRSLVHVNMTMYRRDDVAAAQATQEACRTLVATMHAQGFGEYRSHPDLADAVAATYDFNGNVLHRTLRTLKDALDPRGILSPGNKGIWPGVPTEPNGRTDD